MIKQKVIFRADGNSEIGYGHVMRSLALADMLKNDFECVFATRFLTSFLEQEISKSCKQVHKLPFGDDDHFNAFTKSLNGSEIVVLDNYFFTTEYQRIIKAKGCKLVCIDDIHDKHYVADIVINHAPLSPDDFSISAYTKLLLGFDYALLREEFLIGDKVGRTITGIWSHAFICFGGADFNNLTCRIINQLIGIEEVNEISIVIGGAYQNREELENFIEENTSVCKINVYENIIAKQLVDILNVVDFAIVPCSTILYEVISQQVPVITGYYIDNQMEIARTLSGEYCGVNMVGDLNKFQLSEFELVTLKETINKIDKKLIIDNKVKDNYRNQFKKLTKEFAITIRKAEAEDVDIYFKWANDPNVRQMAINTELIPYDKHVEWFSAKISSSNSYLYILGNEGEYLGQVRFDWDQDNTIIDYSLDECYRGCGFGVVILKKAIERLLSEKDFKSFTLYGKVKNDNIASAKVFSDLNFNKCVSEDRKGEIYYSYAKPIIK